MGRANKDGLPRYLAFHPPNRTYYYKNPAMVQKANLGKDATEAVRLASALNRRFAIETERQAERLDAAIDVGAASFGSAFEAFVEKYSNDYRLKPSTHKLLLQRRDRLSSRIGDIQLPGISTQMLREAIHHDSPFEQAKVRSLLKRFFQFAKSNGQYPQHLPNPVNDLFVDPPPGKKRQRMTLQQFQAIYSQAPDWLRAMMVLALHLALRRIDLVHLRFDHVVGERVISRIRKTDSDARDIEATSVSFRMHPDVHRIIAAARESSIRAGRCPFVIHRVPERKTTRTKNALREGRMEHSAQVLPEYASKAFARARRAAIRSTRCFEGLESGELPTLHEVRSLSSHLYARSGYSTAEVQDLMAHTDPDMTRAYQRGHMRKVLEVDMTLPVNVLDGIARSPQGRDEIREQRVLYVVTRHERKFSQNSLIGFPG